MPARPAPPRRPQLPPSPSGRTGRAATPRVISDPLHAFAEGDWLWACRPGSEADLVEEIEAASGGRIAAAPLVTGLVRSAGRPSFHGHGREFLELAFARQGFPVERVVRGADPAALGRAIADALRPALAASPRFAFHVFVPDSDEANRLSARADEVEAAALVSLPDVERRVEPGDAPSGGTPFGQACLLGRDVAAVGWLRAAHAVSPVRGGRLRIGAPTSAPSRASAKLLEAFAWLGRAPERGDLCVDLGAAPGGWSWVLLERGAHVLAIDPARLTPDVAARRYLTHVQASAFDYAPEEPVDWLFCDMAWRPLEVAALLARWGRNRWARFLVANIKLPMKKKVEHLWRVKDILATGNWRDVRVRQLYHDRDEVTLAAWALS